MFKKWLCLFLLFPAAGFSQWKMPAEQVTVGVGAWSNLAPQRPTAQATFDFLDSYRPTPWDTNVQYGTSFGLPSHETLVLAINQIGSSYAQLVLDGGMWTLTNVVEVPSNIDLVVGPGSWIDDQHRERIGDWDAHGDEDYVTYRGGALRGLRYARPEWWGGFPDDTALDTVAIRAALVASKNVELSRGVYLVGNEDGRKLYHGVVLAPTNDFRFRLYGQGPDKTALRVAATDLPDTLFSSGGPGDSFALNLLQVRFPRWYTTTTPYTDRWNVGGEITGIHFDAGFDAIQSIGYPSPTWGHLRHQHLQLWGDGYRVSNCRFTQFGPGAVSGEAFPVVFKAPNTNLLHDSYFEDNEISNAHTPALYLSSVGIQFVLGVSGFNWGPSILSQFPGTVHAGASKGVDPASEIIHTAATPPSPASLHVRRNVFRDIVVATGLDAGPAWYAFVNATRGTVEDNFVSGCYGAQFVYTDTGRIRDLVVRNNTLLDVRNGIALTPSSFGAVFENVLIQGNRIRLFNTKSAAHADPFPLSASLPLDSWLVKTNYAGMVPTFKNITIRDNTVSDGGGYVGSYETGHRIAHSFYGNLVSDPGFGSHIVATALFDRVEVFDNIFNVGENADLSPIVSFPYTSSVTYASLPLAVTNGSWLTTWNNRNINLPAINAISTYKQGSGDPLAFSLYDARDMTFRNPKAWFAAVTSAVVDADFVNGIPRRLTPLAHARNLLRVDGGFGTTNSWLAFSDPADALVTGAAWALSTNDAFSGRSSLRVEITASGNTTDRVYVMPAATASANADLSSLADGVSYFTAGAFLKTDASPAYARVTFFDLKPPYSAGGSEPVFLQPGVWTHVNYAFVVGAGLGIPNPRIQIINDDDTATVFGYVGMTTNDVIATGSVVYVDNFYLAHGRLSRYEYVPSGEAYRVNYADLAALVPLRIGDTVYVQDSNYWARAHGIAAGEWSK